MNKKYNRTPKDIPPEAMAYYQFHPVEFIEDFGLQLTKEERHENKPGRRVEPQQAEIMNAVAQNKMVSARSGHSVCKTCTIAFLIIWFMYTRSQAKVMLTGSKFDQLKMNTWAEIGIWLAKSSLTDTLTIKAEKMYQKDYPQSWFCQIVTAKEPESITGFHGEHVLIVVDEASGESVDKIGDALLGCITLPDNHILLCGNPTRTTGMFADSHNKFKALWKTLHYSSLNSYYATKEWLQMMAEKFHPDSDNYRVRVLGEFPKGNPKAIISYEECESARTREVEPGDFLELGVDPALEGDDLATIAIRQGNKELEIRAFPKTKPTELYWHVITAVRYWRQKTGIQSRIRIKVDVTGGYGSALVESLALNNTDNIECVPIHSSNSSVNPEYKNMGTEMWFDMASVISKVQLVDDVNLVEELSSREWNPSDMNCIRIEPKQDLKTRIGRSPDRADATILCFAKGPKKVFQTTGEAQEKVVTFDIDWMLTRTNDRTYNGPNMTDVLHYAALVLNADISFTGIAAIYEFYTNKLWVYHEYYQDAPIVDYILREVAVVNRYGTYRDNREVKIIGNEKMFRAQGDRRPLSEIFRRQGLNIHEPRHYDEFGAIGLGAQMFEAEKVIMHERLRRARKEVSLWQIKEGKLEEEKTGYCKALLLILSEIREQLKYSPAPRYRNVSPYSGKSGDYGPVYSTPDYSNKKRSTSWMGV